MPSSKPISPTPSGASLSHAQLAQARSHSYQLFSQLFLNGLTAVLLPYIQQIPELKAVAPHPFEPDDAAAAHYDLFQLNIFPYESFFFSDDGLMGGQKTTVVQQFYQQRGYNNASSEADHVGEELRFLAFLAAAESDAWADNLPDEAARLQAVQQQFLSAHLLCWIAPCLLAVQQQPDPFFAEVAQLTLDLVLTDCGEMPPPSFILPPAQDILAEEKTGFKQIVQHLITPAFSGITLSRHVIGQIARQLELPRGFGSREQMLLNLMRTAVQYDTLPQLLTILQKTCQVWHANYQQLIETYPQTAPYISPWQERSQATEKMLATLMASSVAD